MERTLTFTGHYIDSSGPTTERRTVTHVQKIQVDSESDVALIAKQLLAQVGQLGMIDKTAGYGDIFTLIPPHRFEKITCEVSSILVANGGRLVTD